MKQLKSINSVTPIIVLLLAFLAQGCVVGRVMDTSGNPIANLQVVALGACDGAGCAAHQTAVMINSEIQTGYSSTTNDDGYYMYDPYAYFVPAEDAMMMHAASDSPDNSIKLLFEQAGYKSVLRSYVPEYEEYTDSNTGKKYLIATVPETYLCRDDEPDADGDTICDAAEKLYGTSYLNPDTDNDGVDDNVELYENGTDPGTLDVCVFGYCQSDVLSCMTDAECSAWLQCMEGCGEDDMLCPTQCGAFYQSPVIDSLSQCALDNGCAYVEFPDLPECVLPDATEETVGNIDGFWWVSAIQGSDYVLYDDCQRFIFSESDNSVFQVENSTLVTVNNSTETRVAINNGTFTRTTDGYLNLVYDNWAGYNENYHPYYVTDNTMIMHVCSVGTDSLCHEYGNLILTRSQLSDMSSADMTALDNALQSVFQTSLNDFTMIGTQNCPNGPEL